MAARRSSAVEIPEGVDDATALACGIAGLTGLARRLVARAGDGAEDTVLVLGASGTVGAAAVQGGEAARREARDRRRAPGRAHAGGRRRGRSSSDDAELPAAT